MADGPVCGKCMLPDDDHGCGCPICSCGETDPFEQAKCGQKSCGETHNAERMTGADIQNKAFTDFDHWQKHQPDDLLDRMPIIQQASHYANDEEWHNRKSDADYDFRNN